MHLRLFAAALLALLSACTTNLTDTSSTPVEAAAAPPLWGQLQAGPHAVGFSMEWTADVQRSSWGGSSLGRPVQVWTWYPARPNAGVQMKVADYARLAVSPELIGRKAPAGWLTDPKQGVSIGYEPFLPDGGYERLQDIRVAARHDAPSARGRFPLVVIGQGFGYEMPFHQHVFAEYLASWGYVVTTAPLTGAMAMKPGVDTETLNNQLLDLKYGLANAQRRDDVDPSRIGLFGFDLGGMATMLLAMESPEVDAIVGYDTGSISPRLVGQFFTPRPGFKYRNLRAPYLHATRPAEENAARKLDESTDLFEQSLGGERILVRVPGMRHADFTAQASIEGVYPGFWGPGASAPAAKYHSLLRLTRAFYDRHLKGQAGELTAEEPLTIQRWSR